jgi:4-methyl-5(b-hydroxyethyl)-thiazole monophosphate biosynthesis
MNKVLVPLADGFEEIEAVTIIDVLRRAGIDVRVAALEKGSVRGSHGIEIATDGALSETRASEFQALVLPGGMPGSKNLSDDARVRDLVREFDASKKLVAAICAAPIVLEAAGVLKGRRATSYPGNELPSAVYSEERVVVDGNVITSRGPGTALEFALELVERLASPESAARLAAGMLAR